jgi:hypothetical protein
MRGVLFVQSLLCRLNWHRPLRRKAHWDGLNFVAPCRTCGSQLRRHHEGRWRTDWIEGAEKQA